MQTQIRYADECLNSSEIMVTGPRPSTYFVQLRRNKDGIFIKIFKKTTMDRRNFQNKVNIPFSAASDLINALNNVYAVPFAGKVTGDTIASVKFETEEKSTFNVECYVGKEIYYLRISKTFGDNGRSSGIVMPRDTLPKLVIFIQGFIEQEKEGLRPMELKEGEPLDSTVRVNGNRPARSGRPFGSQRFSSGGPRSMPKRQRSTNDRPFTVVSEVSPITLSLDHKLFKVELVKGNKCFVRITELINNNPHSVLHIQALRFAEFVNHLSSVSNSILKLPKDMLQDVPAAQTTTEESSQ